MQPPSASFPDHTAGFQWRTRLRAAGIHLGASLAVALFAGLLVFALWYPHPYRELSGGMHLFLLVVSVDVALGPLITFFIFNRNKPRSELQRDLVMVALLQGAGLVYGLWTVQLARPVHMVFEYDRFRIVHHVEVPMDLEAHAPRGIEVAPWTGPTLIALRPFRSEREKMEMTMQALQGVHLAARPDLWELYQTARPRVLQAARPVTALKTRFPQQAGAIDAVLQRTGRTAAGASYLPLVGRKAEAWTVLLDATTAEVLGTVPLDSF